MGNGQVRKTVGHLQNQGIDAAGRRRRSLQTHLNSETSLDVALSLVVLPDDSELDDSLGDLDNLEGLLVLGVLLEELRESKGSKGGGSQPVGREMTASREGDNDAEVWRRTGARVEVSSWRA